MKKAKKLLAVVLALMVALTMGIATSSVIFAADGDPTGSITIKTSEKDTTYDFYRILDLTGQDTSNPADGKYDAVTYKLNTKWGSFFTTGAGASYLVAQNNSSGNLSPINVNGTTKYINITGDNIVAFTNAAMDYAITNNIVKDSTAAGTGNDVTVSSLPLGYYLMIPVDASDKTNNSAGSVASITSTVPNADIQVKAKKPGIEKTDNVISADVGQTVTYTITGKVPNTSGYSTYKYIIKDEMTSGLTFNKDVVVTIEGVTDPITSQCTIDYSVANKFSADIPVTTLQGENGANVGKTITLKYTATVNDSAVATSQEKNKATLEYGHNPSNLEKTTPIEEEVYTAKVVINKYTGNDATAAAGKLAGAQFALMNSEGKYYKYTAASGTTPAKVEWVTVTGAPTSGTANVTDEMAQALADAGTAITTKTTNDSGAAEFPGIKDGTYYLVEFVAPEGYNRLDKPQSVVVEGKNVDDGTTKIENKADASGTFDEAKDKVADIQNNSGSELPSTGGIGTTIFYILGALLVIGCGIVLIARRRLTAK